MILCNLLKFDIVHGPTDMMINEYLQRESFDVLSIVVATSRTYCALNIQFYAL